MTDKEKKYSLISVDSGEDEDSASVHTTHSIVDGEETIIVSSESSANVAQTSHEHLAGMQSAGELGTSKTDTSKSDTSDDACPIEDDPSPSDTDGENRDDDENKDDEVPFQRMQMIIIACLVVLVVVFVVYFNFLR